MSTLISKINIQEFELRLNINNSFVTFQLNGTVMTNDIHVA